MKAPQGSQSITTHYLNMLKGIIAITGKPGLYKLLSRGKNNLIVENITTGKRTPTYPHEKVVSIPDISIYTEGGDTLYVMDQISDKKCKEENWVENISLSEAMKRLEEREYEIIHLRFFEGKTQMEVAEYIGISQAQVSRLEKNALRTMKKYLAF